MLKIKAPIEYLIIAGYFIFVFIAFFFGFMLLAFPSYSGEGVKKGLDLCLYTLIPSMYPFMFLSGFLSSCGIIEKSEKLFSVFTRTILRLPGICGGIFFLSVLGGYPIGARIITEMYDAGKITKKQAHSLMLFCVNPAPSFVIAGVGHYMLKSKTAGFIIYFSVILSSLTVGIISNFVFGKDDEPCSCNPKAERVSISKSFVSAASASSRGMLDVCTWVVLFSCIMSLLDVFSFPDKVKDCFYCLLEITSGCAAAAEAFGIPVLAATISFSGLCVQMQLMSAVVRLKMNYLVFLGSRIVNAALSFVYSSFLSGLFPAYEEVISVGNAPEKIAFGTSAPVTVGLIVMCIIMLLGDSFYVRCREKKIIR